MTQYIMNEITLNRKLAISCYDQDGKAKYGQVSYLARGLR
jgi:hypothetical protein